MRSRLDNLPGLRPRASTRAEKLWELDPTLHCSIIGTCLTQGELGRSCGGLAPKGSTSGPVGSRAAQPRRRLAERRDGLQANKLHKALDRRHAVAIRSFAAATDESALSKVAGRLAAGAISAGGIGRCRRIRAGIRAWRFLAFGEVFPCCPISWVIQSGRHPLSCAGTREQDTPSSADRLSPSARIGAASADGSRAGSRGASTPWWRHASRPGPAQPPIALEDAVRDELTALVRRLAKEIERRPGRERCREAEAACCGRGTSGLRSQRRSSTCAPRPTSCRSTCSSARRAAPDRRGAATPHLVRGARVLVVGARPAQIAHWRAWSNATPASLHHDGGVDDNIAVPSAS